jgi:hypothetical protein
MKLDHDKFINAQTKRLMFQAQLLGPNDRKG